MGAADGAAGIKEVRCEDHVLGPVDRKAACGWSGAGWVGGAAVGWGAASPTPAGPSPAASPPAGGHGRRARRGGALQDVRREYRGGGGIGRLPRAEGAGREAGRSEERAGAKAPPAAEADAAVCDWPTDTSVSITESPAESGSAPRPSGLGGGGSRWHGAAAAWILGGELRLLLCLRGVGQQLHQDVGLVVLQAQQRRQLCPRRHVVRTQQREEATELLALPLGAQVKRASPILPPLAENYRFGRAIARSNPAAAERCRLDVQQEELRTGLRMFSGWLAARREAQVRLGLPYIRSRRADLEQPRLARHRDGPATTLYL
eukprot:scaffold15735_cov103-Isochrysis_galbana.AAC.2